MTFSRGFCGSGRWLSWPHAQVLPAASKVPAKLGWHGGLVDSSGLAQHLAAAGLVPGLPAGPAPQGHGDS